MGEERDDEFARLRAVPFEALRADSESAPDCAGERAATSAPVERAERPLQPTRSGAVYDSVPADPVFPLRHPFTIDGVRIDRLLFRPPAFEDVEAVMRGEITELEMHARMADVPIGVLRALRWVDSEIAFFIARSLAPEFDRR